jgi:hypothetical protein
MLVYACVWAFVGLKADRGTAKKLSDQWDAWVVETNGQDNPWDELAKIANSQRDHNRDVGFRCAIASTASGRHKY